jgi:hypothetical protein
MRIPLEGACMMRTHHTMVTQWQRHLRWALSASCAAGGLGCGFHVAAGRGRRSETPGPPPGPPASPVSGLPPPGGAVRSNPALLPRPLTEWKRRTSGLAPPRPRGPALAACASYCKGLWPRHRGRSVRSCARGSVAVRDSAQTTWSLALKVSGSAFAKYIITRISIFRGRCCPPAFSTGSTAVDSEVARENSVQREVRFIAWSHAANSQRLRFTRFGEMGELACG